MGCETHPIIFFDYVARKLLNDVEKTIKKTFTNFFANFFDNFAANSCDDYAETACEEGNSAEIGLLFASTGLHILNQKANRNKDHQDQKNPLQFTHHIFPSDSKIVIKSRFYFITCARYLSSLFSKNVKTNSNPCVFFVKLFQFLAKYHKNTPKKHINLFLFSPKKKKKRLDKHQKVLYNISCDILQEIKIPR